jgi:hypothetical protein
MSQPDTPLAPEEAKRLEKEVSVSSPGENRILAQQNNQKNLLRKKGLFLNEYLDSEGSIGGRFNQMAGGGKMRMSGPSSSSKWPDSSVPK